ncbi:unnamed protein product [Cylindrotheca closterium]|uniref:U-box domain-containing protein n=1 Tax=Cylindrotheca closterium TaxID=2856 RepID=A0AAD2FUF1_9STRA|nr:unnamed protein product [Cylindrotheca closterium]
MTKEVSPIAQEHVLPKSFTPTERQEWSELLEEQEKYIKQVKDAFHAIMECHEKKIQELNKWKEAHDNLALELKDIAEELSHVQEQWEKTSHKTRTTILNKRSTTISCKKDKDRQRCRTKNQSKCRRQLVSIPDFPFHLLCPLTHEPLVDPVIDHEGNTYEKTAILEWLAIHPTSPLTRKSLTEKQLIPNRAIKHAIACWKEYS